VLSGVPQSLPALVKAFRLQDKAKQVGFEWDTTAQVAAKVKEEWNELQEALQHNNSDAIEDEFGDVLFSMVNYARFIGVDPESALERTNKKFKLRFEHIEKIAAEKDLILHDMSLEEMDTLWNLAKKII
jgi:MazG family protein